MTRRRLPIPLAGLTRVLSIAADFPLPTRLTRPDGGGSSLRAGRGRLILLRAWVLICFEGVEHVCDRFLVVVHTIHFNSTRALLRLGILRSPPGPSYRARRSVCFSQAETMNSTSNGPGKSSTEVLHIQVFHMSKVRG